MHKHNSHSLCTECKLMGEEKISSNRQWVLYRPSFLNDIGVWKFYDVCSRAVSYCRAALAISVFAALIGDTFFNLSCSICSANRMTLDFVYGNRGRQT